MNASASVQPKLRLSSFQATDINFKLNKAVADKDTDPDTSKVDMSFRVINKENDPGSFGIIFNIKLQNSDFVLEAETLASFDTDQYINQEFLDSDLARFNATAIAFPYLRAFISMLTLNAGYQIVILPTFNFAQAAVTDK